MKRTAIYSVIALIVGAAAENGSVIAGFPYTSYTFNPALRGHELWIIDVPAMVPMSYIFRRTSLSPRHVWWCRVRMRHGDDSRCSNTCWQWCCTWALWIIDPVTRLGQYHLLGELFHYNGPGFWFGLPLVCRLGSSPLQAFSSAR